MDQLQKAREDIDQIDAEMAALFCKRMAAVAEVAAYKTEHGMAICDPAREQELIKRNCALVQDPRVLAFYEEFLRHTIGLSRAYQQSLIDGAGE